MRTVRHCLPTTLAAVALAAAAARTDAATFVVDDSGVEVDAAPGDGTCATASSTCTLLAAILESEALAGPDVAQLGVRSATLPVGVTVVSDVLTIVGPGGIAAPSDARQSPVLASNATGSMSIVNLRVDGVSLRADGFMRVTSCHLVNFDLNRSPSCRVEGAGSLSVTDSEITLATDSISPPRSGFEVVGGQAEILRCVARLQDVHESSYVFLSVDGGVVYVLDLDYLATGGTGLSILGGAVRVERSRLQWQNLWSEDSASMASVGGGTLDMTSCTLEGLGSSAGTGLTIGSGGTARMSDCVIRGMHGHGVASAGTLILSDSEIAGTQSLVARVAGLLQWGGHGLVVSSGTAMVDRVRITGTSAHASLGDERAGVSGAGVDLTGGSLLMRDSQVEGNWASGSAECLGGGIHAGGGTLTAERCLVAYNHVVGSGGGLAVDGATVVLRDTTISECFVTQGYWESRSDPSLWSFFGGHGGNVLVRSGSLDLRSCTIAYGRRATAGSVGHPLPPVGVGGIEVTAPGVVRMSGSLVTGNTLDCEGEIESEGFNLVAQASSCVLIGDLRGVVTGMSAALEPLADNGGFTRTHALPPDSPALDAGDPEGPSDGAGGILGVDQCDRRRVVDGDGDGIRVADLGAFEACVGTVDTDRDGAADACDGCPAISDDGTDSDHDGVGDVCDPCPVAGDACAADLLRCALARSLSFADIRPLLGAGGPTVLDGVRDLEATDVGSLREVVIAGDGSVVGPGSPGVIVFYELTSHGPIRVIKSGADVRVAW